MDFEKINEFDEVAKDKDNLVDDTFHIVKNESEDEETVKVGTNKINNEIEHNLKNALNEPEKEQDDGTSKSQTENKSGFSDVDKTSDSKDPSEENSNDSEISLGKTPKMEEIKDPGSSDTNSKPNHNQDSSRIKESAAKPETKPANDEECITDDSCMRCDPSEFNEDYCLETRYKLRTLCVEKNSSSSTKVLFSACDTAILNSTSTRSMLRFEGLCLFLGIIALVLVRHRKSVLLKSRRFSKT